MRSSIVHYFIIISTFTLITSCSEQTLTGQWKLRQIELLLTPNKTITLDLTQPDKIKNEMYKEFQSQEQEEGYKIDTAEIKAEIDETVSSFLKTNLTLSDNNQFQLVSSGLMVPTAIPGWHFGDTVQGVWTKTNDTLVLSTGEDKFVYKWNFKVLVATDKDLKLQQVYENYKGKVNELWFVRQ